MMNTRNLVLANLILAGLSTETSHAEIRNLYVGKDTGEMITRGVYNGLENPNFGRLTLLYAHPNYANVFNNHYHPIGAWSYEGAADDATVVPTNSNNQIPETYTGQPPLTLVPGSGPFEGKLVSAETDEHYSDLAIQSVHDLLRHEMADGTVHEFGWGSGEYTMFHSSGGTRSASLDGAVIALEITEISDGLNIGTADTPELLGAPGDRATLGDGNSFLWEPVVWVEGDAMPGTYSVSFKLVDVGEGEGYEPLLESGIATINFRVAEPAELSIERTITLTVPAVHPGLQLEQSLEADGPWTPLQSGITSMQDGNTRKSITVPAASDSQFFRLGVMTSGEGE